MSKNKKRKNLNKKRDRMGLIYLGIISDVISLTVVVIMGGINIYKYKIKAGAVKINSSKKKLRRV